MTTLFQKYENICLVIISSCSFDLFTQKELCSSVDDIAECDIKEELDPNIPFDNNTENEADEEDNDEVVTKDFLNKDVDCKVCQKSFKTNTIFKHFGKSESCCKEYSADEIKEFRNNAKKMFIQMSLNKNLDCKVCQKPLKTDTILRHLVKSKNCDNEYTEDEVKELRNNANKMYIEMSLNKDLDCKVCQKPLKTNTILRHLVKSKSCCEEYSVDEMNELRKNSVKISREKIKIVKVKKKKGYPCNHCDLVLTNRLKFNRHVSQNHREFKDFVCELCGKGFVLDSSLKEHMAVYHKGVQLKCEHCDKTYGKKVHLRRHVEVVHENKKHFHCEKCGKNLVDLYALKKHIASIHEEQKFKKKPVYVSCEICGKSVTSNSSLKNHRIIAHGTTKKFECEICNKKFAIQGQLMGHIREVHNKIKNHKCKNCEKAFYKKSKLMQHIACVHENLRNFKCHICSKGFNRIDNLKLHVNKTHGVNITIQELREIDGKIEKII